MAAPPSPSNRELGREVERVLAREMQSAAQLTATLQISQPSLSRTIRALSATVTTFRVSGHRTPRYALLRQLPLGLAPRQRVYRVLASGHILPFADLEFLAGGATLERAGRRTTLYQGLPPYMAFAAPSGFLGRQVAQQMAQQVGQQAARSQAFPANLRDWGDEHRVAYLFTEGVNLPGNLVFGDAALHKEMQARGAVPVAAADKPSHFVEMASTLRASAHGSSAGGEQPKFLSLVEGRGHVIVKFAKLGSRMAELLPLEHLALRALEAVGVPAAQTQLLTAGGHVFLEVARFDRSGPHGRVGMLSAGALDDEFFGSRDSWSEFAVRCEQAKVLSAVDARQVDTLAAFSELIGNNDTHFENISLLFGEDGEYQGIAPAYDILPMRYAPLGAGVDPALTPIQPQVGRIGARPEVWARAARAAESFWRAAQADVLAAPLSAAMRQLAAINQVAARRFVAPLLPVLPVKSA